MARAARRREAADGIRWLVLVGLGLALTWVAVATDLRVGVRGAPFTGEYRVKLEVGTLLAPGVALAVLLGYRQGVHQRLSWRAVLVAGYLATVAWTLALALVDGGNGLASPVTHPTQYLVDVPAVRDDPAAFVRDFTDRAPSYSVATRTHPPAPVLTLWALRQVGITRPLELGLVVLLVGCLTTPFAAVAVRSLAGEPAARRLLPVLALAPYAVWVAVSMEAVAAALGAAFVAAGVVASEPRRSPAWALGAGMLLGVASLFSYSVGWLAVAPLVVCFRRRRVLPIVLLGVGALIPLLAVRAVGFVWPDGLTLAQRDIAARVGDSRSWALWVALDVLLLVVACGPLVVPALRRARRTAGWPLVLGAVAAIVFAVGSGLARGEVERSWLPFFPWLLVAAADEDPSPWLLGLGAAAAVVLESVVRTLW